MFFDDGVAIGDKSLLPTFFSTFTGQEQKFIVYFAANDEFGRFLKMLGSEIVARAGASAAVKDAFNTVPESSDMPWILWRPFEALDEGSAILKAERVLDSIRALTYLDPNGMPCVWCDTYFVLNEKTGFGRITRTAALSFDRPRPSRMTAGRRLKGIRNYSTQMLDSFEKDSTRRLLSAITTAALARTSSEIENQLISLWSAAEILLSDPAPNSPRIIHYSNVLIPCICLRHVRRYLLPCMMK
jgi:hypothetical protein